ncbi:MAG TPA: hypothetical protein VE262_06475 [Blastocatellia bacterium]|nr:hypothetical protein [Blastocatellia bacterium]
MNYNVTFITSTEIALNTSGRAAVGGISEVRNLFRLVMASPLAPLYPEWQETVQELRKHDRSFVAAPSIQREPLEIATKRLGVSANKRNLIKSLPFHPFKEATEPNRPRRVTPRKFKEMESETAIIYPEHLGGSLQEVIEVIKTTAELAFLQTACVIC